MPDEPKPERNDADLIQQAMDRFKLCEQAEVKIRELALDDLKFRAGEQWPDKVRAQRNTDSRPCLTINVLPSRERQILNDQRQNRPAIHVNAVDDQGDEETAEILQGIVRHIEYDSNADIAYDTAMASAVRIGFGYIIPTIEYESPTSMLRVIKIKRVRNAFMVYVDPACQEPDYSDAEYAFRFCWYTKDDFKREFPDAGDSAHGMDDSQSIGDQAPGWISKDGIRVAEYYYKKYEKRRIGGEGDAGRDSMVPHVKWCKLTAKDILDETDLPGDFIPTVPVLGDELDIDGERVLEGMIRHCKDPVRMQNYMASAEVEAIALAPKAPWLVAEGQLEGHEKLWEQSNTRSLVSLTYKPKSLDGQPLPSPSRNVVEPAVAAITNARLQFADDLKAITGIYDAQLGQRSNESSGIAINQRKSQGQLANFHYTDNLTRAIRQLGRVILSWIPAVYDTARVLRIIGEDGTQSTVKVNQKFNEGGVEKIHDLTVGRYDVTVSAGPSYETKRQEEANSIIELSKANPSFSQVAPDLIVKNLDFAGHEEMGERLKRWVQMNYPGIIADDQAALPPQAQQAIAQAQQQGQVLHQYATKLEAEVQRQKQVIDAKQMENQGRMAIEQLHAETSITVATINAKSAEAKALIDIEFKKIGLAHELQLEEIKMAHSGAHELGMAHVDHIHATQQADQAAQNAQDQISQTGQQQQDMATQSQAHEQTMAEQQAEQQPSMAGAT